MKGKGFLSKRLGATWYFGRSSLELCIANLDPGIKDGLSLFVDAAAKTEILAEVMRFDDPAIEDYVYWVMVRDPDVFGTQFDVDPDVFGTQFDVLSGASNAEAARLPLGATSNWKQEIRCLATAQRIENAIVLPKTTSSPTKTAVWECNARVTLLGDTGTCHASDIWSRGDDGDPGCAATPHPV